jgi:hypothetical protein
MHNTGYPAPGNSDSRYLKFTRNVYGLPLLTLNQEYRISRRLGVKTISQCKNRPALSA